MSLVALVVVSTVILSGCTWFQDWLNPPQPPAENTGSLPVAVIRATPLTGTAPLTARFDASESLDPIGKGLSCTWFFGDGITSADDTPTHVYTAGGTYEVVLVVEDAKGRTSTASVEIRAAAQQVDIEESTARTDSSGCADIQVGSCSVRIRVLPPSAPAGLGTRMSVEGLVVQAYGLDTAVAVFIYDEQAQYAPALLYDEGLEATTDATAHPTGSVREFVVTLDRMAGLCIFSPPSRDAMLRLASSPATSKTYLTFDTATTSVDAALRSPQILQALALDASPSAPSSRTPYALCLGARVASFLGLGAEPAALVGYGEDFLLCVSQLLRSTWGAATEAVFSVGKSANGRALRGTAVLEGFHSALYLIYGATPGGIREYSFQCSPSNGATLVSVDWNFGDGQVLSGPRQIVPHTYDRSGQYHVVVSTVDGDGYRAHAAADLRVPEPTCGEGKTAYNWLKAVAYAKQWATKRNTEPPPGGGGYGDYTTYDCANFVSQCLIDGGADLTGHFADSEKESQLNKYRGKNGTITSCTYLHLYLTDLLGVRAVTQPRIDAPPAWFGVGDVAIFHNGDIDFYNETNPSKHAVIAVERKDGDILCAEHSGVNGDTTTPFKKLCTNRTNVTYHDLECLLPAPDVPEPSAPVLVRPGSDNPPGPVLDTLTPPLSWQEFSGADFYAVAISEAPYGPEHLVDWNPQRVEGTSVEVPSGVLRHDGKYRWQIQAGNSAGQWSDGSNTLYFQAPSACTYSLKPTSAPFSSSGGSGSVSVTTTPSSGCPWTATTSQSWIHITSGPGGTGNGTVNYSVDANTGSARSGTITIADKTCTITQSAPCTYSLNPTSTSFSSSGGSGSVSVTTTLSSGCPWTASTSQSWIHITSGSSGSGNGTVNYSVDANTDVFARTGRMTIAGNTCTVMQDGAECTYRISPSAQHFDASGGQGSVVVTTQGGCYWSCFAHGAWIHITSANDGRGSGTVYYSVDPNTSESSREGMILFPYDDRCLISQDGSSPVPPPQGSITAFTDSSGEIVTYYTNVDMVFVKVIDTTQAGQTVLRGPLHIGAKAFDLTQLAGAPSGTFMTRGITTAELGVEAGETITATYIDPTDSTDASSDTISIISPEPPDELTASFTVTSNSGTSPLQVEFDPSSSTAPAGTAIQTYVWIFGDGTFLAMTTADKVIHTFVTAESWKDFTVTLTVIDSLGNTASTTSVLTVYGSG